MRVIILGSGGFISSEVEKILELNPIKSDTITIKYEVYNNIITKFYVLYSIK